MPPRVKTVAPVTIAKVLEAVKAFDEANDTAKDATSAATRAKTALRNALKGYANGIGATEPPRILYQDNLFTVDVTESEEIDPEQWLTKLEAGEISREQYLEAISVGKEAAKLIVGEDQVNVMCQTVYGKKADVRVIKYDGPPKADGSVIASEKKTGLNRISSLAVGSAAKPALKSTATSLQSIAKAGPPRLKVPLRKLVMPLRPLRKP